MYLCVCRVCVCAVFVCVPCLCVCVSVCAVCVCVPCLRVWHVCAYALFVCVTCFFAQKECWEKEKQNAADEVPIRRRRACRSSPSLSLSVPLDCPPDATEHATAGREAPGG